MTQVTDRSQIKNVVPTKVYVNPKKALKKEYIQIIDDSSKVESESEAKKGITTDNVSNGFMK